MTTPDDARALLGIFVDPAVETTREDIDYAVRSQDSGECAVLFYATDEELNFEIESIRALILDRGGPSEEAQGSYGRILSRLLELRERRRKMEHPSAPRCPNCGCSSGSGVDEDGIYTCDAPGCDYEGDGRDCQAAANAFGMAKWLQGSE